MIGVILSAYSPKTKRIIITVVIAVILLIIMAVYFYKKGKKSSQQPDIEDLIIPSDNPNTGSSQYFNPKPYTDALKSDIYSLGTRNVQLYDAVAKLSNSKLASIYKDWGIRYYKLDKESLTEALMGEVSSYNPFFMNLRNQIVQRLINMGLK